MAVKFSVKLKILVLLSLFSLSISQNYPCNPQNGGLLNTLPICNTSLALSDRANSIIPLLTLQEKISLLSDNASAVPRIGLPGYLWWSESLHGIASNGPGISFNSTIRAATSFPQVIVTASAFNRTLWREIARAIAVEARAMYNVKQAGLTFWAPNINIFRDPRWGRGQETPGEDPLLTSQYSIEYVRGFQRMESDGKLMLSACCKHFTAYDLEAWKGFKRYTFDAKVTEQDMADTYQPPFQSCIEEGEASCLMCSYNQVNGVPACARHDLIKKARDEWGFNGYVVSDCDAVAIIYEDQNFTKSAEDSVALVLKAGMDINCGTYLKRHTESAVKLGKLNEEDIDQALFNLFSVQLRLGLYDGNPQNQNYGNLGPSNVCTQSHRKLALEAARQGIVLLKNDKNYLPLKREKVPSLAIIGPAGNDTNLLGGDYVGIPCNPISLLNGLQSYIPDTTFSSGCVNVSCLTTDKFKHAINIARESEFVIVVAGLNLTEETEDHDRISLLLPGKQMDLVNDIAKAAKNPIILVLMGGGPLDVTFAKENERISSILWIGYPGEVAGQVLAEAIFGEFNPSGRLPITWYPESFTEVPMNDMHMRANSSRCYPGRTYRFYTGEEVYRFGYGLSYSSFSSSFISVPEKVRLSSSHISTEFQYTTEDGLDYMHVDRILSCEALVFNVRVLVRNEGDMDGGYIVLLYSRSKVRIEGSPRKQLIGFERVFVKAKECSEVDLVVDPCKHLSVVNEQGERILLLGGHALMMDDSEHVLFVES